MYQIVINMILTLSFFVYPALGTRGDKNRSLPPLHVVRGDWIGVEGDPGDWGLRLLYLMQPRDQHSTLAPISSRMEVKYGPTRSIG